MEIPGAYICHQSSQRLRIKIPTCKGNAAYFEEVQTALTRFQAIERLEVNVLTGSVLFVDEHIVVDDIAAHAKSRRLFDLMDQNDSRPPITAQLVSHLEHLNSNIRRLTTGEMDLAGILLLALLVSGLVQLLRGNLRMPPWYTAFWYAFGIFKLASVVKEKTAEEK